MISLSHVFTRGTTTRGRAAAALRDVSLGCPRGTVLCILGSPADGVTVLLSVIAGASVPRAGAATVDGKDARLATRAVAYVPVDVVLPESLRVEEVCLAASDVRGEPRKPARDRLGALGLEALAPRRISSLSPAETRAVAIAIALTSSATALVVEEPLAGLDHALPARVAEALRARAREGASIVVATSSVREAMQLADETVVLTQGQVAPLPPVPVLHHVGAAGGRPAQLRIALRDRATVAPFVAALTADPAVDVVEAMASAAEDRALLVVVMGPDIVALARAVTRAGAAAGANVDAIERTALPLEVIRASLVAPPAPPAPLASPVADPQHAPPMSAPPPAPPFGPPPGAPPEGSP